MAETADEYLNRILHESKNSTFKKNIEHVKTTCDEIIRMKATLNCSQVIKYIERHFKSPGRSAIRNNTPSGKRYRCYIELRKLEYIDPQPKNKQQTSPKSMPMPPGISPMGENYILQLQAEIQTLTKMNHFLEQEYTKKTKENPIQFTAMISDGPQTDSSMAVIQTTHQPTAPLSTVALHGLKNLISLGNNSHSSLKFIKKEGQEQERMILETGAFIDVVLYEDQLQELRAYIDNTKS